MRRCAVLLAALMLAACQGREASSRVQATPTVSEDLRLEASLTQYRRDQALGIIQIKVRNEGNAPVTVEQVQLDAPGFAPLEPTPKDAVIEPGRGVDLPVPYGEGRCDASPASPASAGDAVVHARARPDGGSAQDLRLAIESPNDLLDRLLTRECEQRALAQAVSVEFGPSWTLNPAGPESTLQGTVVLRRLASDDLLALTTITGSTVYGIRPVPDRPEPLLVLEPAATEAELPIEITTPSCEPHRLADSKRPYTFPLWLTLASGSPKHTTLEPTADARPNFDDLVRIACDL